MLGKSIDSMADGAKGLIKYAFVVPVLRIQLFTKDYFVSLGGCK